TGFRMYQGTEIHNGRAYCENLTPYYDIDLIEYLFSTNYTEIYRNAFKDSKRYKSKGKTIYPVIIKMNYPDLNKYPVDEGYPPDFLLNPLKSFLIPFRYRNVNKGRHIRSEYEVNGLSRLLAMDFLKTCTNNQDIFNNDILKKECRLHSRGIVEDSDSLNRVLSLAVWMSGTL
ncbi:MAG: hypothetical protein LWX07_01655, partial [Bacteroidetes bacterium]|nr:hypothetical protein [Bacteroidota bacterium]